MKLQPSETGRPPMEDMEYTMMPALFERVDALWEPIVEPGRRTNCLTLQ